MITFSVDGVPKGQPRPRAFSRGGHARMYDPGTAEAWKGQVALAAKEHRPAEKLAGPLYVAVIFLMPRPKRLMRKSDPGGLIPHTAKPDIDNLVKALFDALTQIGMWEDDTQIVVTRIAKFYAEKGGRSGAHILIDEWKGENDEPTIAEVQNQLGR